MRCNSLAIGALVCLAVVPTGAAEIVLGRLVLFDADVELPGWSR